MKKKTLIFLFTIMIAIIGIILFLVSYSTKIYGYVDVKSEQNGIITLDVLGTGKYSYRGYKLKETGNGIYEFKLYGGIPSPFSKGLFPITLQIDNKDGHIKKIIQKDFFEEENNSKEDYETIYPTEG